MEQEQHQQPAAQDTNLPENSGLGANSAPSVDPALLQTQQELERYRAAFNELTPYADVISKIAEDPRYGSVVRDTISAYEMMQKNTPQIPDEIKPVYDKISYLSDKIDGYEKQQQDALARAEAERQAQANAQLNVEMAYANRLVAEHPELQENNYRAIRTIKQYANEDGISFEQAYKRYGQQFVRTQTESGPPTSLSADAGEIGIPSQSRATGTEGSLNFRALLLERLKKAK